MKNGAEQGLQSYYTGFFGFKANNLSKGLLEMLLTTLFMALDFFYRKI